MARSLNAKFFGPAANAGSQIIASVKFDGGAAASGYIVKQVSARRYLFAKVSDPSVTIKAKLVNLATPTVLGTASIAVAPFGGATEYAFKITAKKVSTFAGGSYIWSATAAGSTGQADIIPGTDLAPETATAHAVLATTGAMLTLTLTSGGTGYTVNDVLTVSGGGGTVTVNTVSTGVVATFTVTTGGSGHTVGQALTVTGGTGTGATFTVATISAAIASYVVDDGGSGYDSAPTVTVASGNAVPGVATVVNGVVTAIALGTAGSGYATAPAVIVGAAT